MRLSVITATFNVVSAYGRDSLVRAIESVGRLHVMHEHIVVDGGSNDGTLDILCELQKRFDNLRVISEPDEGIYNALNKGVRMARGNWVYVLGADDFVFNPDCLDEYLSCARCDKYAMIVAPVLRKGRAFKFVRRRDLKVIFWQPAYSHQGVLIRKSVILNLGGFDEKYRIAADYDQMLKIHDKGFPIQYRKLPYAEFGAGGCSDTNLLRRTEEFRKVRCQHFGITDSECNKMDVSGVPPFRLIFSKLLSRDLAYRIASLYSVFRLVARIFLRRSCGH